MKFIEKYQFELISIGIMTLVIGFLFQKPLTGEYTFTGADSLSPSAVSQGIMAAEEEHGEYPLWLPWIFSGLPSVHSFQNISDHYFPNIITNIMRFMGIPSFWNYVFHFILAGMGVFFLLRQLGTSKYSALFGGISFALMPYLITMVVHGHGSQMMTTAWLPWVIWAILRLYDEVNIINLSLLAIIVGFQMQRAHAQVAYYTWMLAGLLIIMLLFKIYDKPNKKNSKWLIYTGFAFVLGLCMAMWIYLPALNYAPYSIRGAGSGGGAGFNYATGWSFSIGEMSTFFIPSFYGFGGETYWGNMLFTDYPNYMGIIVLTFAVIGALFYDSKIKWYFVIAGFLALLISFGKNFFLYQIFYDYFPYFNKFRVPTMFLILTQFSVAVLAGLGLEVSIKLITGNNILKSVKKMALVPIGIIFAILFLKIFIVSEPGKFPKYPDKQLIKQYFNAGYRLDDIEKIIIPKYHKKYMKSEVDKFRLKMINKDMGRLFIFLIIVVSAFYLIKNGWIGRQTLAGIIIVTSIIDMGIVDHQVIEPDGDSYRSPTINPRSLKSNYLNKDAVIEFFQRDTSKYRILPVGSLANENRWAAFQIESVTGYHPAKIFRYDNIINPVLRFLSEAEKNPNYFLHLNGFLKMMNVKYVVSLNELYYSSLEYIDSGDIYYLGKEDVLGEYQGQTVYIYKYKYFIPRVFFTHELQYMPDLDDGLNFILEKRFNPEIKSIVEHQPNTITYNPDSQINIINWTPDKIEIDVITPTKQFMVLSEIFYPKGWQITSHPEWEIYPVNTILRGLYIPEGQYKVIMEFIPQDIYYGSMVTWISSGFIISLLIIGTIINRKSDES